MVRGLVVCFGVALAARGCHIPAVNRSARQVDTHYGVDRTCLGRAIPPDDASFAISTRAPLARLVQQAVGSQQPSRKNDPTWNKNHVVSFRDRRGRLGRRKKSLPPPKEWW